MVVDALINNRDLSALIANVEISPDVLVERQLSRLAAIPFTNIMRGKFEGDQEEKFRAKNEEFRDLNIQFDSQANEVEPIYDFCEKHRPDLVLLDYVQRFSSSYLMPQQNASAVTMQTARRIADLGIAVIVISALNRDSYGGSNGISSFRGTSELEYGADDA